MCYPTDEDRYDPYMDCGNPGGIVHVKMTIFEQLVQYFKHL